MARYIDASNKAITACIQKELGCYDTSELHEMLSYFPTADVAPVVYGNWIKKQNPMHSPFDATSEYIFICSRCGREESRAEPYCHCGAKMEIVINAEFVH